MHIEVRQDRFKTLGTIQREVIEVRGTKLVDTNISPGDREVLRRDRARKVAWIFIPEGDPLPPDMVMVDIPLKYSVKTAHGIFSRTTSEVYVQLLIVRAVDDQDAAHHGHGNWFPQWYKTEEAALAARIDATQGARPNMLYGIDGTMIRRWPNPGAV